MGGLPVVSDQRQIQQSTMGQMLQPAPDDPTAQLENQAQQGQQALGQQLQVPQEQAPVQPSSARGGIIKSLLTNFFHGAGNAMMAHVGVETPEQYQQRMFTQKIQQQNADAMGAYHQMQAQALTAQPVSTEEAGVLGVPQGTMMTQAQKTQTLQARIKAQASATAAQTKTINTPNGAFAWDAATKSYKPISPEGGGVLTHTFEPGEAESLGLDPGIQSVSIKDWQKLVQIKLAGQGTVTGTADTYAYNKLTGALDPLGVGNPRSVFAPANRFVPVTDPATGLNHYMPAGEAQATGAIAASTNLEKVGFIPKARFDDVNRAVTYVNSNTKALDGNMGQKALVANALQDPDYLKLGAVASFKNSYLQNLMTGDTKNYVTGILSLREQIMGMQSMLTGTSQLSDARLVAIWNTLPGVESNSAMAKMKMRQVEGMIGNLKSAYPQMNAVNQAQRNKQQAPVDTGNPLGLTMK